MNKALKNHNQKESHEKIAVQSRAIHKRSKENLDEMVEKRRLNANLRERERTKMRNVLFEQLRSKLNQNATKQEVLQLSRHYMKFLHKMNTDQEFFERYSCYDIQMGFRVYMYQRADSKNRSL